MTTVNQARRSSLIDAMQALAPKHIADGLLASTNTEEPHFCGSLEDAIEHLKNLGTLDVRVSVFLTKKGSAQ